MKLGKLANFWHIQHRTFRDLAKLRTFLLKTDQEQSRKALFLLRLGMLVISVVRPNSLQRALPASHTFNFNFIFILVHAISISFWLIEIHADCHDSLSAYHVKATVAECAYYPEPLWLFWTVDVIKLGAWRESTGCSLVVKIQPVHVFLF